MFDIDEQKKEEIDNMVSILKQLGVHEINLLTRDANTLLMLKQEIEIQGNEPRKAG